MLHTGSSVRLRDGKPVVMTLPELIDALPIYNDNEYEELLYNPVVHVDGEFAAIWAPYVAYENGKRLATGTNNFTMWKTEGRWIITNICDVGRP